MSQETRNHVLYLAQHHLTLNGGTEDKSDMWPSIKNLHGYYPDEVLSVATTKYYVFLHSKQFRFRFGCNEDAARAPRPT